MKFKKHPILPLECNEDGSVIKYEGSALSVREYAGRKSPKRAVNFKGGTHTVAKIVCEVWHGMRDNMSDIVIAKDGNSLNTHYTNLKFGKRGGNKVERSNSKIKGASIQDVLNRLDKCETVKSIAASYNTSVSAIYRIQKRFGK